MTDTTSTPPRQADDREDITLEEALAALDVREDGYVHCFIPAGAEDCTLFGGDWKLDHVREAIAAHGAEIAGPTALSMRHGVCIRKLPLPITGDSTPAYFATREDWSAEQKQKQKQGIAP